MLVFVLCAGDSCSQRRTTVATLVAISIAPHVLAVLGALMPERLPATITAFFTNIAWTALLCLAAAFAATGLGGAVGLLFIIGPLLALSVFNVLTLSLAISNGGSHQE